MRQIVDKHDPEYRKLMREKKRCKCFRCPHSIWMENKYYCPFGAGCIYEKRK
ncbi:MAG TPA: hypothetical protein VEG39_01695 [Clostridia bacterium]|nr:hypothetical protein [Clostridia bacterium]